MDSESVINCEKGYFEASVVWPAVFLGTYLSYKTVCNFDPFCTSYIIWVSQCSQISNTMLYGRVYRSSITDKVPHNKSHLECF